MFYSRRIRVLASENSYSLNEEETSLEDMNIVPANVVVIQSGWCSQLVVKDRLSSSSLYDPPLPCELLDFVMTQSSHGLRSVSERETQST